MILNKILLCANLILLNVFFGLHTYEIHEEFELTDVRKDVIGTIIVSRCTRCGKIKTTEIRTVNNYNI